MARSYLISAEEALKRTQGDFNIQIGRLNNLIEAAAMRNQRKIIVPQDLIEPEISFAQFTNPEVAQEVTRGGFKLELVLNQVELRW